MYLHKMIKILGIGVMTLMMAGCDGSSDSDTPPSAPTPPPSESWPEGLGSSQDISTTDAYAMLKNDRGIVFVDIRRVEEYNAKHAYVDTDPAIDPINEPAYTAADVLYENFVEDMKAYVGYDPDVPVYLICNTARRTGNATDLLVANGFNNVYDILGGTNKWEADGLPMRYGQ